MHEAPLTRRFVVLARVLVPSLDRLSSGCFCLFLTAVGHALVMWRTVGPRPGRCARLPRTDHGGGIGQHVALIIQAFGGCVCAGASRPAAGRAAHCIRFGMTFMPQGALDDQLRELPGSRVTRTTSLDATAASRRSPLPSSCSKSSMTAASERLHSVVISCWERRQLLGKASAAGCRGVTERHEALTCNYLSLRRTSQRRRERDGWLIN